MVLAACAKPADGPVIEIRPAGATAQVATDPDDPAVWVNPSNPAESRILGTNKVAAPAGALVVFSLAGKALQTIDGLDRPNNVDVEYGLPLGGARVDIAVATERLKRRLKVYKIDPATGVLADVGTNGGIPVFDGREGEAGAPMGISLYRRPRDGAIFAIVSPKTGPRNGYLCQYRLEDDGSGQVKGTKVREFGYFSGTAEIEAVAVDDALGYVYYADEGDGIHKWHADPDHPEAAKELAHFGKTGFQADREGIAVYALPDGTGYILCTDQTAASSRYRIFRREGSPGSPHDHSEVVKIVTGGADSTDGIEAVSASLGPQFPSGFLVAMNSVGKNFLLFRWEDVALTGEPKLRVTGGTRE
jgi:3-phytase